MYWQVLLFTKLLQGKTFMTCDKKEISEEGKFLVPLSITRIFELSKWEWDPRMCLFIMLLIEKGIPDIMQSTGGLSVEHSVQSLFTQVQKT